jgi:hypothetical protein
VYFEELKENYNTMIPTVSKNIGEIKPENCLKYFDGSCPAAYISYQKHILGNALREKLLEQCLLSQATTKALEEWNAKKATGEKILFADAWPFIHVLQHTVNSFHHFLPGGNLSAKLEKMTDDSSGTVSAFGKLRFLKKRVSCN